jgi:hypothetical protein
MSSRTYIPGTMLIPNDMGDIDWGEPDESTKAEQTARAGPQTNKHGRYGRNTQAKQQRANKQATRQ